MYRLNYNEKKYFIKVFRRCQRSSKGYILLFAMILVIGTTITYQYKNLTAALITIGLLATIQYLRLNSSSYIIAIKSGNVKCQKVRIKRKTIKGGKAYFDSDISYNIPALDANNFNNSIEGDILYVFDFGASKYAFAAIDNKLKKIGSL